MPEYLVYSRDAAGVAARLDALATAHWDYMDGFADRLIARGPTLGDDGEDHTGSMHIVAVDDAAAARRFADEEPFQRAGLYAETTILRFADLLGGTMWDRPAAPGLGRSTFVIARWTAIAAPVRDALLSPVPPWVFAGLLVTDDGRDCIGAAAALDADSVAAEGAVRGVLAAVGQPRAAIEVHRWTRGGRRGH
jgi:uncharacterized protein YciI